MTSRNLGHRAPLLWLVLPLMAGLAIGKAFAFGHVGWFLAAAVIFAGGAVAAGWWWRCGWAWLTSPALICAGVASYALHRERLHAWEELPPREARLTLHIERTFTPKDPKKISGLARVVRAGPPVSDLLGQPIYFSLTLPANVAAPLRSSTIKAAGVLSTLPRDAPPGSFDDYLSNAGMNFRLTRGRVLSAENEPNAYYRFCARMAQRFTATLGVGISDRRASLVAVLRAMLLGQQAELSEEQDQLFMQSGTMHMFSISGLHIAVIAGGLQAVLGLLRLPRLAQFLTGLIALWLYVDITGGAPSAVRAFIMVAAVQSSLLLRVPGNPFAALTLSALAIVVFEPMQLFSASFQMSYGIVAALVLFGLPLADTWLERWKLFRLLPKATWMWHHHARDFIWRGLLSSLGLGLAATLVSAVSGVMFFQLFTPGALLANLVLIPIASLVIIAGFVSLLGGMLGLTLLSSLFNHAAVLILAGIEAAVRGFLKLPAMWYPAHFTSSWTGPLAFAGLLALLFFGYARRWEKRAGSFWPPFAFVALVFIFGVKFG
jgi:competence protein ComEC